MLEKNRRRLSKIWFMFCLLVVLVPPVSVWGSAAQVEVLHPRVTYPAGAEYPIVFRITVKQPWYIHGNAAGRDGLIPTGINFPDSGEIKLRNVRFPEPREKKFQYSREPVEVYAGILDVPATLVVGQKAPLGNQTLEGSLNYQACSEKTCLPPEKIPLRIAVDVVASETPPQEQNPDLDQPRQSLPAASGLNTGVGFWLTLLGIFAGGLALNLTPCIYPLIPITVSYFGGRSGNLGGRTPVHGGLYILGLALTNSALGVSAAISGGMLGSALQSPVVLALVAGVLVTLALSFFGLWELQAPGKLNRVVSKNFGGYWGTFFMGLTLGIIAAPCLGPFILGLLTYVGQKGDPWLGFIYFFVLSIGLGLPLAVLAFFSGSLKRLPVSGEWMLWVRKALGWVLVGMAAYMLWPLLPGSAGKAAVMAAILLAAGYHLGFRAMAAGTGLAFRYFRKGIGILLGIGALVTLAVSLNGEKGIEWIAYDQDLLRRAAADSRPVILDFYADWCMPCRELEKKVFQDSEIVELSRNFVTMRVDLTRRHPEQKEILGRYRIRGVPTVVFINMQGKEEKNLRIESFVDRKTMLQRIRSLGRTALR